MSEYATQNIRLLKYMKKNGSLTQAEAAEKLGIWRLGARIYDLKRMGYPVKSEMVRDYNRYGTPIRYARYSLEVEENAAGSGD